jgi:hypothetical protein
MDVLTCVSFIMASLCINTGLIQMITCLLDTGTIHLRSTIMQTYQVSLISNINYLEMSLKLKSSFCISVGTTLELQGFTIVWKCHNKLVDREFVWIKELINAN